MRYIIAILFIQLIAHVNAQQLFIHTDRDVYYPGDTVWFKAYHQHEGRYDEKVVNLYLKASSLKEEVVFDGVQFIDRGVSVGQFFIPRSFLSDNLFLYAVTKRNYKLPDYHFYKKLHIVQEIAQPAWPHTTIRASDKEIVELGRRLIEVEIKQEGLLNFLVLKPTVVSADTVSVEMFLDNQKVLSHNQPIVGDSVLLPIEGNQSGLASIVVKQKGEILSNTYQYLNQIKDLWISPDVSFVSQNNEPYARNELKIGLPLDIDANVSISITDANVPSDSLDNIFYYLKLYPFLGASYSNINYNNKNALNIEINDKRLKYEHYDFKEPLVDSTLYISGQLDVDMAWDKYWELYQRQVRKSAKRKQLIRGIGLTYRQVNDSVERYLEVYFNDKGKFDLKNIVFVDSIQIKASQIYDQLRYRKFNIDYTFKDLDLLPLNKDIVARLNDKNPYIETNKLTFHPDYYITNSGTRLLKPVKINKIVDLKLTKMGNFLSKGWFRDTPSMLDLDVQNDAVKPRWISSLSDYLDYVLDTYPGLRGRRPIILYNNEHFNRLGRMNTYTPSSIDEVKLIRVYEDYPNHPDGDGAAIMVYADIYGRNMDGGQFLDFDKVLAYNGTTPYYLPNYEIPVSRSNNEFDDRLTLYWNPNVNFDSSSTSNTVIFYNNVKTTAFRLVIQGMTSTGEIIYYNQVHRM